MGTGQKLSKPEARVLAEQCIGAGNRKNRRAVKHRPHLVIAISTGAVDTNIHADAETGFLKPGQANK
jgi:hypothetical protein